MSVPSSHRKPVEITLYAAPGCHLCEEAHELLAPFELRGLVSITPVNIHDTLELERAYGLRIPVARLSTGAELNWPFSVKDVERALR